MSNEYINSNFNSSNYNSDFLGLTQFAFSEYLMDTYSDQNRMWLNILAI